MCINLTQDYTECGHHTTSITKCPTFYKQQQKSTARTLLTLLFGSAEKRHRQQQQQQQQQHCGRLVPHHILGRQPFCERCVLLKATQTRDLRSQQVGRGAILVERRPTVDEDFGGGGGGGGRKRSPAAERGLAVRESSSWRRRRRQSPVRKQRLGHQRHRVVSSKASVWLPDVYHAPETFARTESYQRSAAEAPPVSPCEVPPKASFSSSSSKRPDHHRPARTASDAAYRSPSQKMTSSSSPPRHPPTSTKTNDTYSMSNSSSSGRRSSSKPREHQLKHTHGTVSGVYTNRTPAFGDAPPLAKPIEPTPAYQSQSQQHRGAWFAAPASTPVPVPVSRPPQVRRQASALANPTSYSSRATRSAVRVVDGPTVGSRPAANVAPIAIAPAPTGKGQQTQPSGPQLRRKPAKTFLNIRDQPLGIGTMPTPLPQYQVYLNAMPSLTTTPATPATPASSLPSSKATRPAASAGQSGRGRGRGVADLVRSPSSPFPRRNNSSSSSRKNVVEEQQQQLMRAATTSARRPHHHHHHHQRKTARANSESGNDKNKKAMSFDSSGKTPFLAVFDKAGDDDGSDSSFVCSSSRRLSTKGRI